MKTLQGFTAMNNSVLENKYFRGSADDIASLNESINVFNSTAHDLEASYKYLQKQVLSLNVELEQKNCQLKKNLYENEVTQNFLNSILESLPTGVFVIDSTKKLLTANKAMSTFAGKDIYDMESDEFLSFLEKLEVVISEAPGRYNVEYRTENSDIRHLKVSRTPVVGKNKVILGFLHIVQDITRISKIGLQSERDKRLKAMGEMAIQVAHEVRNPLGSIELFASILRNELDYKPDLKKMTVHIINEVKGLDNSISNLLQFTLPQEPVFKQINIKALMLDYIEFMKPLLIKNGVELVYKEPDGDFVISADKDLLKQVFLNLTINSFQAMPEGGTLIVKIESCFEVNNSENWVEVSFEDNGFGIDHETLNKIFNPFYTTKEKGTGLGLAIVHNIIEGHNGTIEARSEETKGTCFQISLPAQRKD